jgi:hypothetical protein
MDIIPENKPPLDVEAAIDLMLAATAHRSQNASHSAFGKMVIDEYFVKLREEYKSDPIAKRYLDHLFAAMAAAIRGFSVERDIFGTRWQSLQEQKQYEIGRANRLAQYSPFAEKGIWGKVIGIIGGAGFGGVLGEIGKVYLVASNLLVLSAALFAAVLGLILFEVFLNRYRDHRLQRMAQAFPDSLHEHWEQRSLSNYRLLIKQFLLAALKIREEFYPHLTSMNGVRIFEAYKIPHIDFSNHQPCDSTVFKEAAELDPMLDTIVDRHFTLK